MSECDNQRKNVARGNLWKMRVKSARSPLRRDGPRAILRGNQMKHRIVHFIQKFVLNPPNKLLFALGIAPPGYALLETIGRKTGKPRRTPVGDGRVGGQFWLVAEHGMKAGYVLNIARNPRVPVECATDSKLAGT